MSSFRFCYFIVELYYEAIERTFCQRLRIYIRRGLLLLKGLEERREIEIDHLRWNPWNVAHMGRPGHNVTPQEVDISPIPLDNPHNRVLCCICSLRARLLAILLDKQFRIVHILPVRGAQECEKYHDTVKPTQTADIERSRARVY